MNLILKNRNGFSLVEILVVMAMLGIIMGAVYSLFITNQSTAYTSDETVDVQQNLRIAMDAITKDVRMAGMLVNTSVVPPVSAPQNNVGVKVYGSNSPNPNTNLACPNCDANPVDTGSDAVTINMISASGLYARVVRDAVAGSTSINVDSALDSQSSVALRFASGDRISIIRPFDFSSVNSAIAINGNPAVDAAVSTSTLVPTSIKIPVVIPVEIKAGDMIAKVNNIDNPAGSGNTPSPNTVQYAVVNSGVAGCPANQLCLARTANGDAPVIVAQNIADFQLRYILDDNSVSDAPADLTVVKSVVVTIWGETARTKVLSENGPKIRQLSSVIKLRNRR